MKHAYTGSILKAVTIEPGKYSWGNSSDLVGSLLDDAYIKFV